MYLLLRFWHLSKKRLVTRHQPGEGLEYIRVSCEAVAGRRQVQTILWHSGEDLSSQDVTRV